MFECTWFVTPAYLSHLKADYPKPNLTSGPAHSLSTTLSSLLSHSQLCSGTTAKTTGFISPPHLEGARRTQPGSYPLPTHRGGRWGLITNAHPSDRPWNHLTQNLGMIQTCTAVPSVCPLLQVRSPIRAAYTAHSWGCLHFKLCVD